MDVKREKNGLRRMWKARGRAAHADFLLDVQVKRLHEYKRQLLNAFSILDTYYGLKEGRISRADFAPTVYLFGAKPRRAMCGPRASSSISTSWRNW